MSIYAVLGAGNGGQALAAVLKQMGHEVRLWNRSQGTVGAIQHGRGIQVTGQITFHARIDKVTSDISEALDKARIIFIVVPASAHLDVAKLIAPHIRGDQAIVLNPGRTMGCLEVRNALRENGLSELPIIMETQSLFCACRASSPGNVNILSFKADNHISCIPKRRFVEVKDALSAIYRNMLLAPSVLYTGFENIGAILHPAPVLLNTGWIESRDVFFPHYYYGISKSVAAFLEKIDLERLEVAEEYGVKVRSVKVWHEDNYGCKGSNLFETLQRNSAYASVDAPRVLKHRYITEDIPTGLVPISELARAAGLKTPLTDMIIELGNALLKIDFWAEGRNLRRLGLEGKTASEIIRCINID
ncbi:MAG TPA: NAD/NADP octopine/nopaline dehydrogenase family protein [Bacillota bacterium]|nr:NAD/NADP octopine/nopaline dehydrogenase family protein [Bacillota bacterium]